MIWAGITPWPFIPIPSYFPIEFSYLGHLRHSSSFMQYFCENSFLCRNHLFMAYLIWNSIEKNTAQFHDRAALFHRGIFVTLLFLWLNFSNVIYWHQESRYIYWQFSFVYCVCCLALLLSIFLYINIFYVISYVNLMLTFFTIDLKKLVILK